MLISISGHCIIQVDSTSIFIIGGNQNESTSNITWIVNPNNFHIRQGPPLNIARSGHTCATMKLNGENVIVVGEFIPKLSSYAWN